MGIRDIGVRALHPPGEVGADEEVEDPIDAVRGDAAVLALRNGLRDIIGTGRSIEAGERVENGRAHVGPLLASARHPLTRRVAKRLALVQVMLVRGHYVLEIILGGSARKALPVWRYSPAIRFS